MTRPGETEGATDLRARLASCARLLAIAERDGQARASEADRLRAKAEQCDRLRIELIDAQEERNALLASTSWRLTAPLRVLSERLRERQSRARRTTRVGPSFNGMMLPIFRGETVEQRALPPSTFPEPPLSGPPRVTLFVESFRTAALVDGSARAAVLAAAMAQREGAPLRIISRLTPPEPSALDAILAQHGIDYHGNPSFEWLTATGRGSVAGMTAAERIVAGSWVDVRLALEFVAADRLVYLVDQVEVPTLIGAKADRRVRDIFGIHDLALVFTDAGMRDALRRAGLFERRDAGAPAAVLPAAPSGPDWQRTAAQLLDFRPQG